MGKTAAISFSLPFVVLLGLLCPPLSGLAQEEPASSSHAERLSVGAHDAPIHGVQLHYVVAGHGPLLFAVSPGWGPSSAYMQNTMHPLEKKFKLVFIDTRGSGGSSRPSNPMEMSSLIMADDVDGLREYLGIESIDLMGHSDGGRLAISYATRHPEHLHKLLLLDSALHGFDGSEATKKFLEEEKDDPRYRTAVAVGQKGHAPFTSDEVAGKYLTSILPLYFHDPAKNLPIVQKAMPKPPSSYAFNSQQIADKANPIDQTQDLQKIKANTLIVVGKYDWICPVIVAQRIHDGIQGSTLSVYQGSGHFPWIEEGSRFFPEVSAFFSK